MSSEASIAVAGSAEDWRAWLARNCQSAREVWLILHHQNGGTPSLRYHEAIEQALCFGRPPRVLSGSRRAAIGWVRG